jgi:3-phenylpropionate/trans-cinnamate dioxygenase ferredoxin reductase subunit
MQHYDVIIVGTGHAGVQAAQALRQQGFVGSLLLLEEEQQQPYPPPPLSKAYFSGEKTFTRLCFRPESYWASTQIDWQLRQRVVTIDAEQHGLWTDQGLYGHYAHLIWAAGGKPRRLSCTAPTWRESLYPQPRRCGSDQCQIAHSSIVW